MSTGYSSPDQDGRLTTVCMAASWPRTRTPKIRARPWAWSTHARWPGARPERELSWLWVRFPSRAGSSSSSCRSLSCPWEPASSSPCTPCPPRPGAIRLAKW